jgi:hypothetical protein
VFSGVDDGYGAMLNWIVRVESCAGVMLDNSVEGSMFACIGYLLIQCYEACFTGYGTIGR